MLGIKDPLQQTWNKLDRKMWHRGYVQFGLDIDKILKSHSRCIDSERFHESTGAGAGAGGRFLRKETFSTETFSIPLASVLS